MQNSCYYAVLTGGARVVILCENMTLWAKMRQFDIFLEILILEVNYNFVLWSQYVDIFRSLKKNINEIKKEMKISLGDRGHWKFQKASHF